MSSAEPSAAPRRGEIWSTDAEVVVLVVSSTIYNEIQSEPTIIVVPVFASEPDTGFGVDVDGQWAAPGLISSLRKTRLSRRLRRTDVQRSPTSTTCCSGSWPPPADHLARGMSPTVPPSSSHTPATTSQQLRIAA